MRQREFVQKLGIGTGQVDGDGPGSLIRDNTAFKRAGRGFGQTGISAHDYRIEPASGGRRDLENPLKAGHDISGGQFLTIGKHDPTAQGKGIGFAVVRHHRHRLGQIGNLFEPFGTGGLFKGHQAVIQTLVKLPVLQGIVDMRINRAPRRPCHQPHGAAAMFGQIFGLRRSCPNWQG